MGGKANRVRASSSSSSKGDGDTVTDPTKDTILTAGGNEVRTGEVEVLGCLAPPDKC